MKKISKFQAIWNKTLFSRSIQNEVIMWRTSHMLIVQCYPYITLELVVSVNHKQELCMTAMFFITSIQRGFSIVKDFESFSQSETIISHGSHVFNWSNRNEEYCEEPFTHNFSKALVQKAQLFWSRFKYGHLLMAKAHLA